MTRYFTLITLVASMGLILIACDPPDTDPDEPAGTVTEDGPASIDDGGITEVPDDGELAEKGEELFAAKGCAGCHQMDADGAGPALSGITERRTAPWLARMIMHPEEMTDQDPVAQQVSDQFPAPMIATPVSPDEAEALIAYLATQ